MDDATDQNLCTLVCKGRWGRIEYAVCENGDKAAEVFINNLDDSDKHKIAHLFNTMAAVGIIRNRQRFKKMEGKLFEFKTGQIRIGCFQVGRTWFLTHGFIKKQDNWPKSEITRALRIMTEHGTGLIEE